MNSSSTQHGPHTYDGARDRWQHGKVYPLEKRYRTYILIERPRVNWLRVIALTAAFVAVLLWRFF